MIRLAVVAAALVLIAGDTLAGDPPVRDPIGIDTGTRVAFAGCGAPSVLTVLEPAQARVAARVGRGESLTIVAIGSSSTQGVGATTPDLSYPSRLETELKDRFPGIAVRVINRGKGGEDVAEELARLERDVIAEHPQLVIWQVGTNAVLRRDDLATDEELIERGVAQIIASGSDVVLMDMQYAPRVVARPAYAQMEQVIANVAKSANVGLFRRFDMTRHWQAGQPPDAPTVIGPDGLHMTDRGYFCLAANLAEALAANWWSQERTTQHPPTARIAGFAGPKPVSPPPD
jgi:acyl-CoA thioesterase-1